MHTPSAYWVLISLHQTAEGDFIVVDICCNYLSDPIRSGSQPDKLHFSVGNTTQYIVYSIFQREYEKETKTIGLRTQYVLCGNSNIAAHRNKTVGTAIQKGHFVGTASSLFHSLFMEILHNHHIPHCITHYRL